MYGKTFFPSRRRHGTRTALVTFSRQHIAKLARRNYNSDKGSSILHETKKLTNRNTVVLYQKNGDLVASHRKLEAALTTV